MSVPFHAPQLPGLPKPEASVSDGFLKASPVIGTYLSFFVFGGEFPGEIVIQRFFTVHVLLIPGLLLAAGWLLLLLFGSYLLFWGAVVLIGILGGREFTRMVSSDSWRNSDHTILSLIITIPILTTAFACQSTFLISPGLFLAFCAMLIFTMYGGGDGGPVLVVGRAVGGV